VALEPQEGLEALVALEPQEGLEALVALEPQEGLEALAELEAQALKVLKVPLAEVALVLQEVLAQEYLAAPQVIPLNILEHLQLRLLIFIKTQMVI
jgi:hypothetical protein